MERTCLYSGTEQHPVFADVLKASAPAGRAPIVMIHGG
ncbi:MAG: alpha/beta hydrolase, partial [Hyphomicrobiales bacterium]